MDRKGESRERGKETLGVEKKKKLGVEEKEKLGVEEEGKLGIGEMRKIELEKNALQNRG